MAKQKNTAIAIIIIFLIIILGLIFYLYYYKGILPQGPSKCNYDSSLKIYISTDINQCKVINFLCTKDKKPFVDKCGCGCETINPSSSNDSNSDLSCNKYSADECLTGCVICPPCKACSSISCQTKEFCLNLGFNESWYNNVKPNYCKASDRMADVCIEIYGPVCGWFNSDKIQCIKYPCAQTFSNSCFACKDANVEYWTEGECLK